MAGLGGYYWNFYQNKYLSLNYFINKVIINNHYKKIKK